ncbi:MAG TPA: site-2 protease family protein [Thermoplasmata archaeon]|nr:site-2 protease family protein [Thermoplasmata archaeon]
MRSGPTYYYTWTTSPPVRPRIHTSRTELIHIGVAYVVLTFDLILILTVAGLLFGQTVSFVSRLSAPLVLAAAGAALTGFVCHELAHKVVAQRHGFWAEFRMSVYGLVVSVITASIGFLWAAPGATLVGGMSEVDRSNWGRTSLAGPMSNVAFAAVFYVVAAGLSLARSPYTVWVLLLVFINGWFATFNLIPFGPLDGAKVLRWSRAIWFAAILVCGAFAVIGYLAFYVYGSPFLGF